MKSQLPWGGIDPGTPVSFSIQQGAKGPEAANIQPKGGGKGGKGFKGGGIIGGGAFMGWGGGGCVGYGGKGPSSVVSARPQGGQLIFGTIKSFNEEKGWGHITSPQTMATYGKDMFVMRSALNGQTVQVGDKVRFRVTQGRKGPEASEVSVMAADDGRVFTGVVKEWREKGFGFIQCDETRQLYGKDIFIHKKDLDGTWLPQQGEAVQFTVTLSSEGRPEGLVVAVGEGPMLAAVGGGYGAAPGMTKPIRPSPYV